MKLFRGYLSRNAHILFYGHDGRKSAIIELDQVDIFQAIHFPKPHI